MNNFKKVYTAETLKENKVVTVVMFPMEESIMVPVAQVIDLMKQGENILYFSFNHDSVKINDFLQSALKKEENPENITGNLGIIDAYQIPNGEDWIKFIEDTIVNVKKEMTINYIVMDLMPFVETHPVRPANEELVVATATILAFTNKITPIIVKTLDMPIITTVQNPEQSKKIMDDFMNKDIFKEMFKESKKLMVGSDLVLGIKRDKQTFWKKLMDFLLFWRKRNNFTLKVIKNRSGSDGQSYRMNIDMDEFKTEIL